MADYINREELIEHLDKCRNDPLYDPEMARMCCAISIFIENMPAADVQPVKHGRWRMHSDYPDRIICSHCNLMCDAYFCERDAMKYCPNCGARMDGEQK